MSCYPGGGGGGLWGAPAERGAATIQAIEQGIATMRIPAPPLRGDALDALPSPAEFAGRPLDPAAMTAPVHCVPDALPQPSAGGAVAMPEADAPSPSHHQRQRQPSAEPSPPDGGPRATRPASNAARGDRSLAAVLQSPIAVAAAVALLVAALLAVVAPPFVLKPRRGGGNGGAATCDPSSRWSRPRQQVSPARIALWSLAAGLAAFLLPLAVDRVRAATVATERD